MKYLLLFLFLISAFSCSKDFLEKKQLNALSTDTFWQTEKDAKMGVIGCYDVLQKNWIYNSDHQMTSNSIHYDGVTDDLVFRWSWEPLWGYPGNAVAPNNWFVYSVWQTNYMGIARCNEAIARIGAMKSDQIKTEVAQVYLAEVKFIRALLYSNMVSMYGDIPLVTVPQLASDMPVKTDRAKVVAFILSELLACADKLPATRPASEFALATKGAAYTLLARTNLFNINQGGTYDKAAEYAKNAMDVGGYKLFNDYEKLFKFANEINNEIVFTVPFVRGPADDGSMFVGTWGPQPGNFWLYPMSNLIEDYYCTDGKPIKDAVTGVPNPLYDPSNIWKNRDPRLTGTFTGAGALWNGLVVSKADMSSEPTGFVVKKWREESGTEDRFDSPQDFYVFRYAHVLLMRAEALIMSGNITDPDVNGCINAVRARVKMPGIENAEAAGGQTLSQQDYVNIIQHEWRVETAVEGWRYFNLKRWGKLKEAYDRVNAIDAIRFPSVVKTHVYVPRLEVFPVPQQEMDRNPKMKQNSLW